MKEPMHTAQITYVPLPIEVLQRLAAGEDTMVDSEVLREALVATQERYEEADEKSQELLSSTLHDEEDFSVFSRKLVDVIEEHFPDQRSVLISAKPVDPEKPTGGAICTGAAVGYADTGPLMMVFDLGMAGFGVLGGLGNEGYDEERLAMVSEALERTTDVLLDLVKEGPANSD